MESSQDISHSCSYSTPCPDSEDDFQILSRIIEESFKEHENIEISQDQHGRIKGFLVGKFTSMISGFKPEERHKIQTCLTRMGFILLDVQGKTTKLVEQSKLFVSELGIMQGDSEKMEDIEQQIPVTAVSQYEESKQGAGDCEMRASEVVQQSQQNSIETIKELIIQFVNEFFMSKPEYKEVLSLLNTQIQPYSKKLNDDVTTFCKKFEETSLPKVTSISSAEEIEQKFNSESKVLMDTTYSNLDQIIDVFMRDKVAFGDQLSTEFKRAIYFQERYLDLLKVLQTHKDKFIEKLEAKRLQYREKDAFLLKNTQKILIEKLRGGYQEALIAERYSEQLIIGMIELMVAKSLPCSKERYIKSTEQFIINILNSLPEFQREAIKLRYLQEFEEISKQKLIKILTLKYILRCNQEKRLYETKERRNSWFQ